MTKAKSTYKVIPPVNEDGILLIRSSPRCKAIFSDGNQCKRPACRLNKGSSPSKYTNHCSKHGGKQEKDAYLRHEAAKLVGEETKRTTLALSSALDLAPTPQPTSSDIDDSLHQEPKPEDRGSLVTQKKTSSERTNLSNGRLISDGGVGSEKPVSKIESSGISVPGGTSERHVLKFEGGPKNVEPQEAMYAIPDRTLRSAFENKLKHAGQMNLNNELALVRALIQQLITKMDSKNLTAEELGKLDKLLMRADKLLNTIMKVEATRKVQYTRESLRMDVMKVVQVIRKLIPEEGRRRLLATELARVLGPSLAESGDIVVSREVFRKG